MYIKTKQNREISEMSIITKIKKAIFIIVTMEYMLNLFFKI